MPKFPVKYGRDGRSLQLSELVGLLADKLDGEDVEAFCDVMDEEFIYGAWGHILDESREEDNREIHHYSHENILLTKDIRGLAKAMYELGRRRASAELLKSMAPSVKAALNDVESHEVKEFMDSVSTDFCDYCGGPAGCQCWNDE